MWTASRHFTVLSCPDCPDWVYLAPVPHFHGSLMHYTTPLIPYPRQGLKWDRTEVKPIQQKVTVKQVWGKCPMLLKFHGFARIAMVMWTTSRMSKRGKDRERTNLNCRVGGGICCYVGFQKITSPSRHKKLSQGSIPWLSFKDIHQSTGWHKNLHLETGRSYHH